MERLPKPRSGGRGLVFIGPFWPGPDMARPRPHRSRGAIRIPQEWVANVLQEVQTPVVYEMTTAAPTVLLRRR